MNRKLKPVIAILVFLCISLGALSCISATNDTSIISSGTSSSSNTTTISVDNTTSSNTNQVLSSTASSSVNSTTSSNTNNVLSSTASSSVNSTTSSNTNQMSLSDTNTSNDIVSSNNNTSNLLSTTQVSSDNNSIISESNDSNVSIISKNNSNIISNNFTEKYGEGQNFTIRLVDDNGNPIIGQHIILNLTRLSDNASKIYYATTDVDGYAYLQINLAVGNYTVTTSYNGNNNYNSSKSKYNTITVNSTISSKLDPYLISNNFTEVYGAAQNYTIRLVDDNGNPIAGQHIALNLTKISNGASKIYWVTTDTAGYAYLEINLAPGEYSVSGSYSGTTTYEGAETVYNTIIVTSSTNSSTNNNTNKQNTSSNKSGYVSISDIVSKANDVFSFVHTNQRLPNYVTINGETYTMAQFAYLVSAALIQINNGNYDDIQVLNVTKQSNVTSSSITGTLSISDVISMASRINSYISTNLVTPKYDSSNGLGKLTFENYLLVFCQALTQYGDAGSLPSTVSVNTSAFSSTSSSNGSSSSNITTTTTGSGINDLNTISDLSAYLAAYTHCEVNNAKIQALAASLTSGLTTTWAKATAIYNYVRDQISYKYYSNSKYGAAGTLSNGYGNCVDQASLVIALCRAAGIPARYVHGQNCKFTSGLNAGHVWAQILVDGVWYAADPTSTRNSLGVIKNWNTASFTLKSISASISF